MIFLRDKNTGPETPQGKLSSFFQQFVQISSPNLLLYPLPEDCVKGVYLMLRLMLMSGEITLPGTLMKMTNWLVMTRHAASAGRGMCHQPTQARAEQRTNWIASNNQHSSGVVNCTNCPVQPTSLIMNTYTCRNKTHVIALYASLSFEKYSASIKGRYLHRVL